jgi:hypothetical protein
LESESPILSDYESEGTLSRRNGRRAKKVKLTKKMGKTKGKPDLNESSDGDDDDVPLVTMVAKPKLDVLAEVSAGASVPTGVACIGLNVARDFGVEHGVCLGNIVRVDIHRRRPLYHVVYTNGDEEDYEDAELQYAREFYVVHTTGAATPAKEDDGRGKALTCNSRYLNHF